MSILAPGAPRRITPIHSADGADLVVAANTLHQVTGELDITRFPLIAVQVRADSSHSFTVQVQFAAVPGGTYGTSIAPPIIVVDLASGGQRGQSEWIESRSDRLRILIDNNDNANSHSYDLRVWGIG